MTTRQYARIGRGFTLMELMIAMALGVIMTGAIVFIFVEAQRIFTDMDAKVTVYQYARSAFDLVERDLVNAVKTVDMEFFQDSPTMNNPGHYDAIPGDPEAIPVRDAGQKAHKLYPGENYIYAMTISQPKPYTDGRGKARRHDSIYFRTVASINGQTKPLLVEYALDYKKPNGELRRLPSLVRRTWLVSNIDNTALGGFPKISLNENGDPSRGKNEPVESEVCLYVIDLKFEIYLDDKRDDRPGRFFSAKEATLGNVKYFNRIKLWNFGEKDDYRISCMHDARHLDGATPDFAEYREDKGMLVTESGFSFPMSAPGDRIFLFGSSDPSFKSRDLTIKSIERVDPGSSMFGVTFVEPIPTIGKPNPPKMRFRTGWLPPMVRMTVKIQDEKAKAVRTMTRQFKLLGA